MAVMHRHLRAGNNYTNQRCRMAGMLNKRASPYCFGGADCRCGDLWYSNRQMDVT